MPSATPIYDALAEEMLGPLTDFVPRLLIASTEALRPACETRTRGVRTPSKAHRLDPARRVSPAPARHRLT